MPLLSCILLVWSSFFLFYLITSTFSRPLCFCLDSVELVLPWVQCMGLVSRSRFLTPGSLRSTKLRKETSPSSYSPINSITKCTWPITLPSSPPFCFLWTAPTRPSSSMCCLRSVMCNKSSYWFQSVRRRVGARLHMASGVVLWLILE